MPDFTYNNSHPPANWTGVAPSVTSPAAAYSGDKQPAHQDLTGTLRSQVERWYLKHLRSLDGDDAFVAMILALILYEQYLRITEGFVEEKFSEGFRGFRVMSEQFGPSPQECFHFWQDWRNGLLHRAMPGMEHFTEYSMSSDYSVAIMVTGKTVRINPWRFRDRVLEIIGNDRAMWKDQENPLAKILRVEGNLRSGR